MSTSRVGCKWHSKAARFVASIVLPVPPFPLAIAMVNGEGFMVAGSWLLVAGYWLLVAGLEPPVILGAEPPRKGGGQMRE